MIKVVVDAMGGDYVPAKIAKGAVEAAREGTQIQVIPVGQEDIVKKELEKQDYPRDQVGVAHVSEVIETEEPPVNATRKEEDSSIVVGMNMVKKQETDVFVSAGSLEAILVGGQVTISRIRDVECPPSAPLTPTETGVSLLADCGANVGAGAPHLIQFARMGSIYMEHVIGTKHPRVVVVNIGAEEGKGSALVKETFLLLKECKDISFIGSIETREVPYGGADVIVCEAFVGNVILKLHEGVGATLINRARGGMVVNLRSKTGALFVKPALKEMLKTFSASQYGGAPLLGLNGLVVRTHRNSKAVEVKDSIIQCVTFREQETNGKIRESLKPEEVGQENQEA